MSNVFSNITEQLLEEVKRDVITCEYANMSSGEIFTDICDNMDSTSKIYIANRILNEMSGKQLNNKEGFQDIYYAGRAYMKMKRRMKQHDEPENIDQQSFKELAVNLITEVIIHKQNS